MGTRAQALDTFLQRHLGFSAGFFSLECAKNMVFGGEVYRWEACWDDDHHCFSRRCMIDKWFGFFHWFGGLDDGKMFDMDSRWVTRTLGHSITRAGSLQNILCILHPQYLSWTVEVTWSLAFVPMSNVNSGLVEACAVIIWGGAMLLQSLFYGQHTP